MALLRLSVTVVRLTVATDWLAVPVLAAADTKPVSDSPTVIGHCLSQTHSHSLDVCLPAAGRGPGRAARGGPHACQ